jgi:hypothetical protein
LELRKALASRRQRHGAPIDPANPCPWWTSTTSAEHAAWLQRTVPKPVAYHHLDPCQKWSAGQPVVLNTEGQEHWVWVRLRGCTFSPRWLGGSLPDRLVSLTELSTRNPRQVWRHPFELQLALALLSSGTGSDARCSWLRDIDEESEPELFDLLLLAREELGQRTEHAPTPWSATPQEPRARRGWTRTELEGLRVPEGVVEPVLVAAR